MRLSFKVWPQEVAWPELRDFWREADDVPAYHAGWIFDHLVAQSGWRNHELLADASAPCYEAWTLLTYLAASTQRLRLGTLVTSATHRHPAVLAKIVTTLDVLSNGRVEVGVGAGWNEEEHTQFGIPYPGTTERFDRFEDYVEVLDRLLRPGIASYAGVHHQLDGAFCSPSAVQRPRPPLTIGGRGPKRALPIVARWADHWNFPGGTIGEFHVAIDHLARLREEAGRSMDDLDVSVQLTLSDDDRDGELAKSAHRFAEAGATHLVIRFRPPLRAAALHRVAHLMTEELGVLTSPTSREPAPHTRPQTQPQE